MRHTDPNEMRAAAEAALGLRQLNERSREIFKRIVETYLATGEPVGSRNLSRALPMTLSPASVRNVMSDLEGLGLIYAPHTSAGRLPTQTGLRLFIDGLLEIGDISEAERSQIESRIGGKRAAPRDGGIARRGRRDAVGAIALRRRGAGRQAEQDAEAGRVRQSRAGQGACRAGRRGRRCREPDRPAARRLAALLAARGLELYQCPHRRADAGRGARAHREGDRGAPRATRRVDRAASSPRVSPPGRATAATARA